MADLVISAPTIDSLPVGATGGPAWIPVSASLALAANTPAVALTLIQRWIPATASLTLAPATPGYNVGVTKIPTVAALTLSGTVPALRVVYPASASLTVSGLPPKLDWKYKVTPITASLVLTRFSPSSNFGPLIAIETADIASVHGTVFDHIYAVLNAVEGSDSVAAVGHVAWLIPGVLTATESPDVPAMAGFTGPPEPPVYNPVNYPSMDNRFYRTVNAMWPELINQQAIIAPPRNGMDRTTGKLLQSWEHVEQSMSVIFSTPYHRRVLRRWVGSFVPHILGESIVERIITRFFWAIATGLDLWEPDYAVKQVFFMGDALNQNWAPLSPAAVADLIRIGEVIFRTEGVWYPRGHLGDFTPYSRRASGITGLGGNLWDVKPVTGLQ